MFSFGQVYSVLGARMGDAPALIHGDQVTTWANYARRTEALAAKFREVGQPGDKVAHLMRNSPAYLETTGAAFKARMVHVNVNYRYSAEELWYILDNSDAVVVVFDAEFADAMDSIRARLPLVKLWLQVGGDAAPFAQDFDAVANSGAALSPQDHAFGDQLFIYTGGTTGYPKGVMWEQGAIFTLMGGGAPLPGMPAPESIEAHVAQVLASPMRRRLLALPPLMHGSAFLISIYTLAMGGAVVTTPSRSFDPVEALRLAETHQTDSSVIVGDAFARPLLRALEAGHGNLGPMMMMVSSGTMWSPEVKAGLIRHQPSLVCLDAFGSSEGLGYGASMSAAHEPDAPTRFMHDGNTLVLDEDNRPIAPGSGRSGRVARTGLIPLGYYKDPAKSAATFVEIDGRRYTIPGDWATVEADGSIVLLGRGSQCINSGGEKIFPEEVEEALKTHPCCEDALVFGTPDETWGQAVTAVAELNGRVTPDELVAHVKAHLAHYKAPKRVVIVDKVPRAPNGKADYAAAKELAASAQVPVAA